MKSELAAQKVVLQAHDLKQHVQQAVDEVRIGSDQLHRKLMEDLDKEKRDRHQSQDDLQSTVRELLDQERTDREMHYSKVNSHFANVHGDLTTQRDENKMLGGRLQEVEDIVHNIYKEQMQTFELKLAEPASKIHQMERRIEHVLASIGQESVARQSLAEVFEQMMKTERTKMTNLVTQKAAFARLDCEEMQKNVQESLDRQRSEREAVTESLQTAQARNQAITEDRLGDIDNQWKAMDQRCQTLLTESRDSELRYRKLFDDQVGTAIRDLKKETQDTFADERAARVSREKSLVDQFDWIGEQHDRMRDVFLQKGPRKPVKSALQATRALAAGEGSWLQAPLAWEALETSPSMRSPRL